MRSAGRAMNKILIIDNYDSFTYNLVQYFGVLGYEAIVKRNDEVTVAEAQAKVGHDNAWHADLSYRRSKHIDAVMIVPCGIAPAIGCRNGIDIARCRSIFDASGGGRIEVPSDQHR